MRLVYFNEVKRGFKIVKDRVIFYGSLYLLRNPELPDEAATKEYIDRVFDDLNTTDIGKGLINENTFPAFMGDIRNPIGVNDFKLIGVGKKGRWCRPVFDKNGRVLKGELKLVPSEDELMPGIPYKVLDFKGYKSLGHKDNPGLSIKDFTNNAKIDYLAVHDPNDIGKKVRIDKNIYNGTAVINEEGVEDVMSKYVSPSFMDIKHDSYDNIVRDTPDYGDGFETDGGIGDTSSMINRHAGGMPWKHQYDINRRNTGLATGGWITEGRMYDKPQRRIINMFVDRNRLCFYNNDGSSSMNYPLNGDGSLDPNRLSTSTGNILPAHNDGSGQKNSFVIYHRHFFTVRKDGNGVRIRIGVPDSGNGSTWVNWIDGPVLPGLSTVGRVNLLIIKDRLYAISLHHRKVLYCDIGSDPTKLSVKEMQGGIDTAVTTNMTSYCAVFMYDGHVYVIPGCQDYYADRSSGFTQQTGTNEYYRVPIADSDILTRFWDTVVTTSPLAPAQREAYCHSTRIYVVSGLMDKGLRKITKTVVGELNLTNGVINTDVGLVTTPITSGGKELNDDLLKSEFLYMWLNGKTAIGDNNGIFDSTHYMKSGHRISGGMITDYTEKRHQQTNGDWHRYSTVEPGKPYTLPEGDSGWLMTPTDQSAFSKYFREFRGGVYGRRPDPVTGKSYRKLSDGTLLTKYASSSYMTTRTHNMSNNGWQYNYTYHTPHIQITEPTTSDGPPPDDILVDKEPFPSLSIAASQGRLFICNGYQIFVMPLNGGLNNYDKYLDPWYIP